MRRTALIYANPVLFSRHTGAFGIGPLGSAAVSPALSPVGTPAAASAPQVADDHADKLRILGRQRWYLPVVTVAKAAGFEGAPAFNKWVGKMRKNDAIPDLPPRYRVPFGPPYNRRDLIVGRIKMLDLYVEDYDDDNFDEGLWWIVDEMADVVDEDHFDLCWSVFYDWADAERVWVELWNADKTALLSI